MNRLSCEDILSSMDEQMTRMNSVNDEKSKTDYIVNSNQNPTRR